VMARTLRAGFLESAERFGDRDALAIGDTKLSYAELRSRARRIAATLDRHGAATAGAPAKLTAVFGHRHPTAFAGILGALMRGHGYVPLNPIFPTDRSAAMFERSKARCVVVDPTAYDQLDALVGGLEPRVVLLPDADDVSEWRARLPAHTVLGAADLEPESACTLGDAFPDEVAYLLFTSGSTGRPKGVMVAHRNVNAFLDSMCARYAITEQDRFSSTFDLTFDLSVFDMFCAWEKGACVCVPTAQQKLFPGKYIKQHALTVWFSVPSTGVLMSRLKMLKPGSYESLRWTLFCGEALPVEVVQRFAEAAPKSIVENLYGPTELTIACTLYRWDNERSPAECELGVVPIGEPYPGMEARVVDEQLREVPRGEAGELIMTGVQTALGYLEDPEKTAAAFVHPPGEDRIFYRTGDRVKWGEGKPLVYLGRVDNQIKIQGYRVELGEIEAVLREESQAEVAIAVGWPRTASGADGIVAFVGAPDADPDAILARVKARLPGYLQPSRVILVNDFPLNANGKVDRKALQARLEAGS
jgi:amino acid adenylation domain-containing protein